MKLVSSKNAKVFLTGVTGFVGKVVLEELLRRKEELGLEKIFVLIRPSLKGISPEERFKSEVVASPCFSKLSFDWVPSIEVVGGELSQPGCGLREHDRVRLAEEVTHIINCAASVEFDLPIEQAAAANITASLQVLEFARWCRNLQVMVNVSTAYVTPHLSDQTPVSEQLVPLKRPAREIYHAIVDRKAKTRDLLRETGHPNTYTLTKCLAEHLLMERKGDVPLILVRPSIVSASWRHPFPGWIDSKAAFAGFVSLIGAGYLRAVVARYSTLLDVVPCDVVAARIIDSAFGATRTNLHGPQVRHAVAGVANSCNIETCIDIIEKYFRRYPVARYPHLRYVGAKNLKFTLRHWQWHLGPGALLGAWHGLRGKAKQQRRVLKLVRQLDYLNTGFPYFTHKSFDFRASMPLADPDFKKEEYIETVCRGVYRHLMRRDDTEVVFAGAAHRDGKGDLSWALSRPEGNWAIRTGAYFVRKALRRCAEKISFDRLAFEEARAQIPSDHLLVIVPTHRSYMDFVLCSYLFFDHPELGIAIPHIAAAEEFSRIPFLGWLFQKTQAFYVKRGLGRANPEVTKKVRELVQKKQTLEFFIEGTRSRSRKFLPPRRGMLRALQATGQTCTLLPVALSYDRIPEEDTFMRELKGGAKPTMRLMPLLRWVGRLFRGEVSLGRIHITCGKPVVLHAASDLPRLSREVMAELQTGTVATDHQLRAFLRKNPQLEMNLDELKSLVLERGGKILESPLGAEEMEAPDVERSLRYQWMHLFYPDAEAAYPHHPVVQNHITRNGYGAETQKKSRGSHPKLNRLLYALFEPLCRDTRRVAEFLGAPGSPLEFWSPRDLLLHFPDAHLPTLEEALEDLIGRRILEADPEKGGYRWGPEATAIESYRLQLSLPKEDSAMAAAG